LSEPATVTLDVTGQTPPTVAVFSIDGDVVATSDSAPFETTIDPFTLTPGEHTLTVDVANEGGVSAIASQTFTVAALPPIVTITGLESGQSISEATEFNVEAVGQTPVSSIVTSINGEEVGSVENEASTTVSLDPMALQPGENTASVTVTLESGQSATSETTFLVAALPPVVTVTGLEADETVDENRRVGVDVVSQTAVTNVIYRIDGRQAATQSRAPFTFDLDVLAIGPGDHTLAVVVTNAGGQSSTIEVPFSVPSAPSLTATASAEPPPTNTVAPTTEVTPTDTVAPATEVAPTDTVVPTTEVAVVPSDTPVPPTNTPRPSNTPRPTATVAATEDEAATAAAVAAVNTPAEETQEAGPTEVVTEEATEATDDAVVQAPTGETPVETPTEAASATPVEITEVTAETTPEDTAQDTQGILIIVIILVLLLVVLFYLWNSRRRRA
jgi:hypothetical protein